MKNYHALSVIFALLFPALANASMSIMKDPRERLLPWTRGPIWMKRLCGPQPAPPILPVAAFMAN